MEQNRNNKKDGRSGLMRCLACGSAFVSGGPFLRVCPACKESEEWRSGNCDFALGNAANDNDADPV